MLSDLRATLADDLPLQAFLAAMVGNLSVVCVQIGKSYEAGRPLPARFQRYGFWLARAGAALGAGVLAAIASNQSPVMSFYLGASFQVIIENALREPPPAPPP